MIKTLLIPSSQCKWDTDWGLLFTEISRTSIGISKLINNYIHVRSVM